jgi:hypothetical protein
MWTLRRSVEFAVEGAPKSDVPGISVTNPRRTTQILRTLHTPAVSATATARPGRGRDGLLADPPRVPHPDVSPRRPRTQAASGITTAVQEGQRRAAIEIEVVHSGQGRVFAEAPFSSWYFLYGTTMKK